MADETENTEIEETTDEAEDAVEETAPAPEARNRLPRQSPSPR